MITRIIRPPAVVVPLLLALGGTVLGQAAEKTPYNPFPPLTVQDATPYASDVKLDEQVKKVIDGFFDLLQQDHVDQAYDQLTKGTKIAEKPDDVALLKSKTNQAIDLYGDIVGREVVSVKNVGNHLLRATCLSLGKNYPLRWRFYFYRNDNTWRLIDIRVDDRLIDMFDEKAAAPSPDPQ